MPKWVVKRDWPNFIPCSELRPEAEPPLSSANGQEGANRKLPSQPCFQLVVFDNPENVSCHVMAATSNEYTVCGMNPAYTTIDLTKDELRSCVRAYKETEESLSEFAMFD